MSMNQTLAEPEIIPETVDPMHPFVQDRHDPDVAIREMPPINEVAFIPKEEPIDSEFRRDGFRGDAVALNIVEGGD